MPKLVGLIASLLALALTSSAVAAAADGRDRLREGEEELLVRPVGSQGKTLAVVRGPGRSPTTLPAAEAPPADPPPVPRVPDPYPLVYELRAEVRSADGPPLVVGAQAILGSSPPADPRQDLIVLDALVEPDAVTLAVAADHALMLWRVSLAAGDGWFRAVEARPPAAAAATSATTAATTRPVTATRPVTDLEAVTDNRPAVDLRPIPPPLRSEAHVTLARAADGLLTYTVTVHHYYRAVYTQSAKDVGAFKLTRHESLLPPPPATRPGREPKR